MSRFPGLRIARPPPEPASRLACAHHKTSPCANRDGWPMDGPLSTPARPAVVLAAILQHGGEGFTVRGSRTRGPPPLHVRLLRDLLRALRGFLAPALLAQPERVVVPDRVPLARAGLQTVRLGIEQQQPAGDQHRRPAGHRTSPSAKTSPPRRT